MKKKDVVPSTNAVLFSLLVAMTFSVLSCKQTNFAGFDNKAGQTKITQSLSCEDEKQKSMTLKNPKTNVLAFSKSCTSEVSTTRTPADIVFVIDITGSMEDSLNTVKNGVEKFALGLRQDKGWDARFAAVGYRDNIAAQVTFTDEKNLAAQISSWKAVGGNDAQEAGQSGLAKALELLAQDFARNPGRATASKNILFIGDAISYALNNDHFDFSTAQLERVFASIPAELRSQMKFYYSAAKEVEHCIRPSLFGCSELGKSTRFAAHEQIKNLAKALALPGKGFEFPFTENILLNEFMDEFTPGQACSFRSASIRDSSGNQISMVSASGSFELPRNLKSETLDIEVERCCGGSQQVAPTVSPTAQKDAKTSPAPVAAPGCKTTKTALTLKIK